MYATINSTSYISGDFGYYDSKVKDNSARYGRNATDNFIGYVMDYHQPVVKMTPFKQIDFTPKTKIKFLNKIINWFKLKQLDRQQAQLDKELKMLDEREAKMPALKFELKYMPGEIKDGNIDTTALLAAAYEELGQKKEISTADLTRKLQMGLGPDDTPLVADAVDINRDGKVSLGEYATTILASDAFDSDNETITPSDIDGIITNKGQNRAMALASLQNLEVAHNIYKGMYEHFGLQEAEKDFIKNKNNIKKAG